MRSIRLSTGRIALAALAIVAAAWLGQGHARSALRTFVTSDRAAAAAERVRPRLERDLAAKGLAFAAPVFLRIFKRERELELWVAGKGGRYALFRTYPICTFSGRLGPKTKQGDGQAPEGFYRVARGQLNPASAYHLAFNLGYPNAYDRAHAYTGDYLMVHGQCVSIGCYAMGDAAIEEIYTLVEAALRGGQPAVEVQAFPFRLEDAALAAESGSRWQAFWSELKPGYDAFERHRVPPRVTVQGKRYVVSEG
ncbi:L,D-transpeptidase family protein [Tahibacter amnicola]|uniref:Murein L,D-transpeptidase n=1 Tax=Tahibacter amnicola TaxID=2976241 RepID=A0ABY6BIG1_9GAMM|nr:murein L,D-transpeptidase family protein [Tahibacter amnicola]UXI69801.1 murein L,D-transpeptidase [Tahibacter amnicola]